MDLFAWWNLIFVLPFLAALLLLLLQAFGAMHVAGEADAEHDLDADHDSGVLDKALSLLGVGRVPLSLLLTSFALLSGFTGWASNQILQPLLVSPALFVGPSIGVALASSFFLTRAFALLMSRVMPAAESYATSKRSLLGREGTAISEISQSFGRVRVRDEHGNLQDVSCRADANTPLIPDGATVTLMSFDDERECYIVSSDVSAELERAGAAAAKREPLRERQ